MDAPSIDTLREPSSEPMADIMDTLTVKYCQDLYKRHGDVFLRDTREVVRIIRDAGQGEGLKNSNYFHALTLTHVMLEHTSYQFRMLTGPDGDEFLGCLDNAFRDMLDRVKAAGNKARVILLDTEPKHLAVLQQAYPKNFEFELATVTGDDQISHFIVCDNDMVRDELPHGRVAPADSASSIKAEVDFSNRTKARILSARFDRIWKTLRGE